MVIQRIGILITILVLTSACSEDAEKRNKAEAPKSPASQDLTHIDQAMEEMKQATEQLRKAAEETKEIAMEGAGAMSEIILQTQSAISGCEKDPSCSEEIVRELQSSLESLKAQCEHAEMDC